MKRPLPLVALIVGVGSLGACRSHQPPDAARLAAAELLAKVRAEELAAARKQLTAYEHLYGPPPHDKPRHNLRTLQAELPGLTRKEVVDRLGKPHSLAIAGKSETWDYHNICFAPHAGRVVETLEIWFEDGKASNLSARF